MMLLYYINNNTLISHPFYLGVCQDESEKWYLHQENFVGGCNLNKNTAETAVHVTHSIINT